LPDPSAPSKTKKMPWWILVAISSTFPTLQGFQPF
jgi:hypothetical protein